MYIFKITLLGIIRFPPHFRLVLLIDLDFDPIPWKVSFCFIMGLVPLSFCCPYMSPGINLKFHHPSSLSDHSKTPFISFILNGCLYQNPRLQQVLATGQPESRPRQSCRLLRSYVVLYIFSQNVLKKVIFFPFLYRAVSFCSILYLSTATYKLFSKFFWKFFSSKHK